MADGDHDDYQNLLTQKRFLGEIEHGIRIANRKIIHKRIPSIDKENVMAFAVSVARLRGRYLDAAFKLGINENADTPNQAEITKLRLCREMYEEARSAFDALREAIEKGYVDIGGI